MNPKDHAILLLSQGISPAQVAAAVGVSDSYISQLRADPDVVQQISEKQAAATLTDISFDETLQTAEALALERIEKHLPFANMGQALAAFRILNTARRRSDPAPQAAQTATITVNLMLPANSVPRYIANQANEIIEVEGKTMLTATPASLDKLIAAQLPAPQPSLSRVSSLEKAATMLDGLRVPRVAPRRAPLPLSPDIL